MSSIDPLGEPRVVYAGSRAGAPSDARPEIVLVRPNVINTRAYLSGMFRENLGILTLATHLEAHGVPFGVLEASLFQCSPEQTAELSVARSPRWIGISAYCTWVLDETLQLAALIKEMQPAVQVVIGGHGASFVAREILERHPAVDAVIRSEGEESLLRLVGARDRREWAEIPNLTYRSGGEVIENAVAPLSGDLDGSPLPSRFARDVMERDPILSRTPLMMFTSKGCYDRCVYCTVTQFYRGWRGRSPKHVADELEALLKRFSWRTVHFWDDQFAGPGKAGKRRAIELAEEISRRKLDIVFHVTIRPSDVTEELVEALAGAGLRSVFIGVESSDQAVLDDYFGKHIKTEESLRAIDLLWRNGVHRIVIGFMVFHPKMTWQTFRRDLDLLDSFPTVEHSCLTSRTVYYPGSELWTRIKDRLGPDAYKDVYLPPLPDAQFQRLFDACCNFYNQTMEIEMLFSCLEERHLHDLQAIDFLASLRVRLFRFLSARARVIADLLEQGRDPREKVTESCNEIFQESLQVIGETGRRLGGDYFDDILMANQLLGYRQLLRPGPSAARPAAVETVRRDA